MKRLAGDKASGVAGDMGDAKPSVMGSRDNENVEVDGFDVRTGGICSPACMSWICAWPSIIDCFRA